MDEALADLIEKHKNAKARSHVIGAYLASHEKSALYRPQTGYYADLLEEAAALWESLSQNHCFVDGNKRTAFAATYTFLAMNGLHLTADAEETYVFMANLYKTNQFKFDKLVPWLRAHVEKRK